MSSRREMHKLEPKAGVQQRGYLVGILTDIVALRSETENIQIKYRFDVGNSQYTL